MKQEDGGNLMFDKNEYWKNRKQNKRGQGIEKPWNKVYKASEVQIQFDDKGNMISMPRYIRRNKKGNT